MHRTVNKGKHRFSPISLGLYICKKRIVRKVRFIENCAYDIGQEQTDINKLFGIGFLPGHHKYSARVGWVYNPFSKMIEVWSYTYDPSNEKPNEPEFKKIGLVELGSYYIYRLTILKDSYLFEIGTDYTGRWKRLWSRSVKKSHDKKIGYKLGAFFGGNMASPHTMEIDIKRL